VLVIDDRAIGDSTDIVAECERRCPDNPLYPIDPDRRERALEHEDYFDEQLGPQVRVLFLDRVMRYPSVMLGAFAPDLRTLARLGARATFPRLRRQVIAGFGIDEPRLALAHEKLRAAGERFRASVQPNGYLVGSAFSVADLTLASMLSPVVAPEEFPYPQPQRGHQSLAEIREQLATTGLLDWTREIYARHRGVSAEIKRRPAFP
jgi:glutathione S-transferase